MDQKEYDRIIKYEKGKLHFRYLFIIAGILAVIGISIALGGNNEALGQISMASTVSSIILSAIAIFMSISGEYKLTYTHNKLLETSDKMSDITANIENANSLFDETISQKLLKLDDISNKLEQIGRSVDNVEKEMFNRVFHIKEDSDEPFSDDIIWKIYSRIIRASEGDSKLLIEGAVEYAVVCYSEGIDIDEKGLKGYLESLDCKKNYLQMNFKSTLEILAVFIIIGIANIKTAGYFIKNMKLSETKINEIKKYL